MLSAYLGGSVIYIKNHSFFETTLVSTYVFSGTSGKGGVWDLTISDVI
jgi:hypothetical protein